MEIIVSCSARFNNKTLTHIAKESKLTPFGVLFHKGLDLRFTQPASYCHTMDLIQRRGDADVRISPLPEAVTRSTGIGSVLSGATWRASMHAWAISIVRIQRAVVRARGGSQIFSIEGIVCEHISVMRPQKCLGSSNCWPISSEPTAFPPSAIMELTIGLAWKNNLGNACHNQWVDRTGNDGEQNKNSDSGTKLCVHRLINPTECEEPESESEKEDPRVESQGTLKVPGAKAARPR